MSKALSGVLLVAAMLVACSTTTPPSPKAEPDAGVAPSRSAAEGVRLLEAPPGEDVAALVRAERDRERAAGRELLVYVGATWCEPCQYFHEAAKAGELDRLFPNLSLLEFDLDKDRDRIVRAGYRSDMIPLFVRPGDDGRGTDRKIQGSVKGKGAVTNIAPRLRALLAP